MNLIIKEIKRNRIIMTVYLMVAICIIKNSFRFRNSELILYKTEAPTKGVLYEKVFLEILENSQ